LFNVPSLSKRITILAVILFSAFIYESVHAEQFFTSKELYYSFQALFRGFHVGLNRNIRILGPGHLQVEADNIGRFFREVIFIYTLTVIVNTTVKACIQEYFVELKIFFHEFSGPRLAEHSGQDDIYSLF